MANPLLNDDQGNTWQLSATVDGKVQATLVANVLGTPLLIREADRSAVIYELRIVNGGFLAVFLASSPNLIQPILPLSTSDPAVTIYLRVFHGFVQTSGDATFSAVIVLGQLLPGDGAYPTPLQPGGIGSIVTMPAQTDGEKLGLWSFGCSHWFNHIEVRSAEIGGVTSALLVCPICLYVQRIIQPYSDAISGDANAIIFA